MPKVLIATDWLAACAGCHMSLLDLDERLVELLHHVTITSSPVTDLKVPPESGVTVGVLTGAISNTHNVEVARRMRSRCQFLVAVGDCATFGGIVAARNLVGTEAALQRAYLETESTVDGLHPGLARAGAPAADGDRGAGRGARRRVPARAARPGRTISTSYSPSCWPVASRWCCRRRISGTTEEVRVQRVR